MKTEAEIQRAHDILIEIILDRVPNPFPPDSLPFLIANADVLCWLLDHDHNTTFSNNLAKVESYMNEAGCVLEKADKPFTDATHPLGPQP